MHDARSNKLAAAPILQLLHSKLHADKHTAGMLQNVRFSQCLPKQHNSHHSHTPQSDWLVQDAAGSAVGRMVRL